MINSEGHNQNGPPVGGALLECLLSYPSLGHRDAITILNTLIEQGFFPDGSENQFYAYNYGDIEFEEPPISASIGEFVDYLESGDEYNVVGMSFSGTLFDIESRLTTKLYVEYGVIVISILEDLLWAYGEDPAASANFRRLQAFAQVCIAVSNAKVPIYAHMGTEYFHPEEFTIEEVQKMESELYSPMNVFSETGLRELFDWYLNVYTHQWDSSLKIE